MIWSANGAATAIAIAMRASLAHGDESPAQYYVSDGVRITLALHVALDHRTPLMPIFISVEQLMTELTKQLSH